MTKPETAEQEDFFFFSQFETSRQKREGTASSVGAGEGEYDASTAGKQPESCGI